MPRFKPKLLPSAETLRALFEYSPGTGVLLWKAREPKTKIDRLFNSVNAGKPAGTKGSGRAGNQYLVVGIERTYFKAHRIIWKMMTGEEPPEFIDHKDGDNFNNRWNNYRAADNGTNLQNAKLRRDNKTGVKGVCWEAKRQKYVATIAVNKRYLKVGRFDSLEEAKRAINDARERLHGEFARRS